MGTRARLLGTVVALVWTATAWADLPGAAYRGAETNLLDQLRRGFETAPDSPAKTRELIQMLDGRLPAEPADWPPVFLAYRAALAGLAGKHSRWPLERYRGTKEGLVRLDARVAANPESIEIRMLRFSFCRQLPDFFGRESQAEADLAALAEMLEQGADAAVAGTYRRDLIRWILRHGRPAPESRQKLESALDALPGGGGAAGD
ncbi:MAG: hypothetical protein AB7V14_05430 [Kiritimatiellia bacterium]